MGREEGPQRLASLRQCYDENSEAGPHFCRGHVYLWVHFWDHTDPEALRYRTGGDFRQPFKNFAITTYRGIWKMIVECTAAFPYIAHIVPVCVSGYLQHKCSDLQGPGWKYVKSSGVHLQFLGFQSLKSVPQPLKS